MPSLPSRASSLAARRRSHHRPRRDRLPSRSSTNRIPPWNFLSRRNDGQQVARAAAGPCRPRGPGTTGASRCARRARVAMPRRSASRAANTMPDRDRLAVRPSGERVQTLQRVPERVPVVQRSASRRRRARRRPRCAAFALTHRATSASSAFASRASTGAGSDSSISSSSRSMTSAYFATSASPERKSRSSQRRERVDVGEDGARLGERAHEVLAFREVHGGLAADGRVDLREQRGGYLDERQPAHVRGRDESRQVARRSAAERHDEVVAVGLLGGELVQEGAVDLQRLRVFARRDRQEHDVEPGGLQAGRQGPERPIDQLAVGHDERPIGASGSAGRCVGGARAARRNRRSRRRGAPGSERSHGPTQLLDDRVGDVAEGEPLPSTTWAANSR